MNLTNDDLAPALCWGRHFPLNPALQGRILSMRFPTLMDALTTLFHGPYDSATVAACWVHAVRWVTENPATLKRWGMTRAFFVNTPGRTVIPAKPKGFYPITSSTN